MDNYMLVLPIISHIVAALYLQKQKYNKFITACFWLVFAALAYCVPYIFAQQLPIFLTILFLQLAFFCATAVGTTGEKVFLILAYTNSFSICFGLSQILSACLPLGVFQLICQIILIMAIHAFLYHVQLREYRKARHFITSGWWKISIILLLFLVQFLDQYAFRLADEATGSQLYFSFIIFSLTFYAIQFFIFASIHKVSEKNKKIYENTILKEMVNKDILTNMRNRLAYVNFVTEQNQALRTDSSPSFVFAMLDIDNFKMINDIRGHAEGDNILKLVGAEIMAYFNPLKCQSYRFGGDEFALLFENMPLADAQAHIDTFCAELYRSKQISLSYGCASVDFRNEKPFETAYKQADMIMYSYKQQKKCST